MKRAFITTSLGIAIAVLQSTACAEVDATLAQSKAKEYGCLICHATDKKKVGPAYQAVSEKFKGKNANDVMVSMKSRPAHESVLKKTSDDSLKVIFEWILTL